jgi:uncharacterized protein (TIGR00297 family)
MTSGTGRFAAGRPLVGSLTSRELVRKLLHLAVGLAAFALRDLGPFRAAVLALAAVVFNVFLLPRLGGRRLWREDEVASGRSVGMILYPSTVLLLILVFSTRLEVAAAAWGFLAFGDGMATLVGRAFGRIRLPWNPEKSWAGTLAYVVWGTGGASALLLWTAPGRYEPGFAVAVCLAASALAAMLESLPHGLDDNLAVPLIAGLFLLALLLSQGGWEVVESRELVNRALVGLTVNAALAAAGYAAKSVNAPGVLAGILLGTVLWAYLDWRGYLLLLGFVLLGTACTRIGWETKSAKKLAQEEEGRRGARHAVANTGVAIACAVFSVTTPPPVSLELFFRVACAAAFATAAADTAGSEIGQLWGRRTFLPTTLERVPQGTEGAVSFEGTMAGIFAAVLLGAVGAAVGLYPWFGVVAVSVAAAVGSAVESVIGALVKDDGPLHNEAMNFLNTLVGALAGGGLALAWLI